MCSVSFILGPGSLWTTFKDSFHLDSFINVPLHSFCGIPVFVSAYTVPSFNLSLLFPHCYNSKSDNEDNHLHLPHREMTKYTTYDASTQVGGCEHPIFIYGQRPRH